MTRARKYPQREYREVSTSTDLSCAGCQHVMGLYYHVSHKPDNGPEAKGGIGPSVASGKGGEDG